MCVHVCAPACVEARGQPQGSFPQALCTLFHEAEPFTGQEFPEWTRMVPVPPHHARAASMLPLLPL